MARLRRQTAQDRADARARAKSLKQTTAEVHALMSKLTAEKIARIEAISDEEWQRAVDGETIEEADGLAEARPWRPIVDSLPDVGRLVHLALRMDSVDEERVRTELLAMRRRAYESELGVQSERVGCGRKAARVTAGWVLNALNQDSTRDAQSITNTYNYEAAVEIARIREETPTANRHVYARRLLEWSAQREIRKDAQIAEYTEASARSMAQRDFYANNAVESGTAHIEPRTAVCPVCKGWIARGEVPLDVAMNAPPPYHPNCPHGWVIAAKKMSRLECEQLWLGQ